jgi:hypothetical protein
MLSSLILFRRPVHRIQKAARRQIVRRIPRCHSKLCPLWRSACYDIYFLVEGDCRARRRGRSRCRASGPQPTFLPSSSTNIGGHRCGRRFWYHRLDNRILFREVFCLVRGPADPEKIRICKLDFKFRIPELPDNIDYTIFHIQFRQSQNKRRNGKGNRRLCPG